MGTTTVRTEELGTDWRRVAGVATAWFEAPSSSAAAALADRALEASPDARVEVRASGVRVRLDAARQADAVSAAARDLGLAADPAVLQEVGLVLESSDPDAVTPFWQRVLGYATEDGALVDPLRRDPALRVAASDEPRSLRQRIHLDVSRPAAQVEAADLGEPYGPYGVCHADADGNEADVIPGDPLEGAEDWWTVFGAVATYRVTPDQQRALVTRVAALADDAGFPLLVDARPGVVVVDSAKDRWEDDVHGLGLRFADLAARVQAAARDLGATADPAAPRFVQLFLDAADVLAVRAFWLAALGYVPDGRAHLDDVVDPRRLGPVLAFQELDASDDARRRQRNRLHVELAVPADLADARLTMALAAGGHLLDEQPGRRRVADPEGNELVLVHGDL